MTVSLRSKPSTAKAWALTITPDEAGITVGAGPVRWFGERFDVPETFVPCVYSGEPADYRIALCRTPDGPRLVLVMRTPDGEDLPADHEPVVDLARWRLAAPEDTCESVTVHVTQRTVADPPPPPPAPEPDPDDPDAEPPASIEPEPWPVERDPEVTHAVGASPVIPEETPERAAKRARRARVREIEAELRRAQPATVRGLAERVERLELLMGVRIEVEG